MTTIEIFRAGRHTDSSGKVLTFSVADLEKTAAAYNPQLHEAPGVIGHPKDNVPAYCWAKSLKVDGDILKAELDQEDPAFAEMVNSGRFKKVSASFYTPESKENPVPGVYSLRHIGFLGAQPPAVKGLKSASFSDSPEGITDFSVSPHSAIEIAVTAFREFFTKKFGTDPEAELNITTTTEEPETMGFSEAEAKAKLAEIESREKAIADKEAKVAKAEAESQRLAEATARQIEFTEFLKPLTESGRVLPVDSGGWVEIMQRLAPSEDLNFGESGSVPALTWLKSRLSKFPKLVEFGEVAPDDQDFAEGMIKSQKEMTAEIQQYVEKMKKSGTPCSYNEASKIVMSKYNKKGG
jgi:hypothetical protein